MTFKEDEFDQRISKSKDLNRKLFVYYSRFLVFQRMNHIFVYEDHFADDIIN